MIDWPSDFESRAEGFARVLLESLPRSGRTSRAHGSRRVAVILETGYLRPYAPRHQRTERDPREGRGHRVHLTARLGCDGLLRERWRPAQTGARSRGVRA